jgi:hypothetical protein
MGPRPERGEVLAAWSYRRGMATERARTRCRERLERLCASKLDSYVLRRGVIAELKLAIGFARWCAPLRDPDALIAS